MSPHLFWLLIRREEEKGSQREENLKCVSVYFRNSLWNKKLFEFSPTLKHLKLGDRQTFTGFWWQVLWKLDDCWQSQVRFNYTIKFRAKWVLKMISVNRWLLIVAYSMKVRNLFEKNEKIIEKDINRNLNHLLYYKSRFIKTIWFSDYYVCLVW